MLNEGFAQHIGQALAQCHHAPAGHGAPLGDQFAVVPDGKAHVRAGQRMSAHSFHAVGQLGGVGFQKLAASGGGEEQLAHFNGGAPRARSGLKLATAAVEQPTMRLGIGFNPRQQRDFGDRADCGQGFAPKTHGAYRFQIAQAGDLAGGVALEGGGQFGAQDAIAVVFHADQPHAAGLQAQGDLGGARIEGVVHQFAHDRSGALHHFASSDLADQFVGKLTDGAAGGLGGCWRVHPEIVGLMDRSAWAEEIESNAMQGFGLGRLLWWVASRYPTLKTASPHAWVARSLFEPPCDRVIALRRHTRAGGDSPCSPRSPRCSLRN